jgi:indole-3-pyruvate monooxygenase
MGGQTQVDTIVVGASAAGLATAACLQRAGVTFAVLEQAPQIAAAWRGHYDRLHLHTNAGLSGLPYHGFPRRFPRYPARDQVVAYLEEYAAHFALAPRFGQRVTSVVPDNDSDEGAGWLIRTATDAYRSRHVVIATGNTHTPHLPRWPGQESFGAPVLHSSAYRNGRAWAGRKVLVVGIGNSGAEIALDLVEQGVQVCIAVRGPVNVVPRDFLGLPITAWSIALGIFPDAVADAIAWVVGRLRFGRLERLGLRKLPFGPAAQFRRLGRVPILDQGTIARIRRGEITVVPTVASFSPGQVHLQDGSTHRFDAVVLATGYRPALDSLLGSTSADLVDGEGFPRQSGAEVLPGLYLCGYHVTSTGMLREIGREARRIARAIAARG